DGNKKGNGYNFDIPNMDELRKQFKNLPWEDKGDTQSNGQRAKLGVRVEDSNPSLKTQFKIPSSVDGAVVIEVTAGSPAESLGMKSGDVIRELNGKKIASVSDLRE